MPDVAMAECRDELRAACRRPIDPSALDELFGWLRPQFDTILGHPEGRARWDDHGQQMRDNGRHVGALADFFGYCSDVEIVTLYELTQAFDMVRSACRVRVRHTSATEAPGADAGESRNHAGPDHGSPQPIA